MKERQLENLPGQTQSSEAKRRRKEILENPVFHENSPTSFEDTTTHEDRVESYALASIVIEELWKYIQTHPLSPEIYDEPLPEEYASASSAQKFIFFLNTELRKNNTRFSDFFKSTLDDKKDESLISKNKKVATVEYLLLQRKIEGKNELFFPAMNDLVLLTGQMADVLGKIGKTEDGKEIDQETVIEILRNPYSRRFLVGLTTNTKELMLGVVKFLQSDPTAHSEDPLTSLNPEYFTVKEGAKGEAYFALKPEIAERLRLASKMVSEKRSLEPALQCPAVYTGKFGEMYDWTINQYVTFLKRQ